MPDDLPTLARELLPPVRAYYDAPQGSQARDYLEAEYDRWGGIDAIVLRLLEAVEHQGEAGGTAESALDFAERLATRSCEFLQDRAAAIEADRASVRNAALEEAAGAIELKIVALDDIYDPADEEDVSVRRLQYEALKAALDDVRSLASQTAKVSALESYRARLDEMITELEAAIGKSTPQINDIRRHYVKALREALAELDSLTGRKEMG